jgi:hypothetical protein
MLAETLTIRIAPAGDPAAARLAALDSAAPIAGPTLVAEVGGRAVAAIAYDGSAAVADPFARTAAALEELRVRSGQLRGERVAAGLRRWRRGERSARRAPRPAPAPGAGRLPVRPAPAPRVAAARR